MNCIEGCNGHDNKELFGAEKYPLESAICITAYHSGVIKGSGGKFQVEISPGMAAYHGNENNGVQSKDFKGTKLSATFI